MVTTLAFVESKSDKRTHWGIDTCKQNKILKLTLYNKITFHFVVACKHFKAIIWMEDLKKYQMSKKDLEESLLVPV